MIELHLILLQCCIHHCEVPWFIFQFFPKGFIIKKSIFILLLTIISWDSGYKSFNSHNCKIRLIQIDHTVNSKTLKFDVKRINSSKFIAILKCKNFQTSVWLPETCAELSVTHTFVRKFLSRSFFAVMNYVPWPSRYESWQRKYISK